MPWWNWNQSQSFQQEQVVGFMQPFGAGDPQKETLIVGPANVFRNCKMSGGFLEVESLEDLRVFSGAGIPTPPSTCDYCGREKTDKPTCQGCGAPR